LILWPFSSLLGEETRGTPRLSLGNADHLTIIGNALAERMQHDGWLETIIRARVPKLGLTFRNLGFSGDELATRLRSEGFGTPDEWLARCQTDVVLAFFGYNESFADEPGLDRFKHELASFIDHTKGQKYNGESPPQLVLFSPIAYENLNNPELPSGEEHNRRLRLYTSAAAEMAAARNVTYVDLFHPTLEQYTVSDQPLTINGIHLNRRGNRFVAEVIGRALFDEPEIGVDEQSLERLRREIIDKNFYWFHRYRTTDGYNVFGGRSHLEYDGVTNRVVMQREMEILDIMTANRDRRIGEITRTLGQNAPLAPVDDGNTPSFIAVKTNKPGPLPGGKHVFLGGDEAISKMTVAAGMKVELFASEEQFPELVNPVQMAFDTRGRLWVAAWPNYPHWRPKDPMNDKLLILEDLDNDGRADRCQTFVSDLHNPTGFEFYGGGVLVAMAPDLLFLKDTNGDDVADVRQRVLHGLDSADTHHTANSFTLSPGGALFFQEGVFHQSQLETIHQGSLRNNNACIWRFEPRTWRVDRYVPFNFANPHGHVFDRWGQDFVHDGTGAQPFHAALFSGHREYPDKVPAPPQLYQQRTRPCPATEILSSRHFADENQGNLLVGNVIGFQGILQYKLEDDGASFQGVEVEPILSSSDPNFRPVDLEIGPDGALYFTDWQNPIIGHMQHHIRDPNRDKTHGRVYRVICPGRPLLVPERIAGQPVEHLLDLLKSPEDRVRYRARIELSGRDTQTVIQAVKQWLSQLNPADPDYAHQLLEALWVHQFHNRVNEPLLRKVLASPEPRARAAATRVLCYWQDRLPDSLDLLRSLAADSHPRVRLEAVRAASFSRIPEAVEVPLISVQRGTDRYLDFVRNQTMHALEPYWKRELAEGRRLAVTTEAGMRFLLKKISNDELLKLPRDRAVYGELLVRPGIADEYRGQAIAELAKLQGTSEIHTLLGAIKNIGEQESQSSLAYDLARLLAGRSPAQLSQVRDELQGLATDAAIPIVRQIGFVALIMADGKPDAAWKLANESVSRLRDFVSAVPLIPDPSMATALYPKLSSLLDHLPADLAARHSNSKGTAGRFVRIELPGERRTLTLAEVEVYSDGRNVAREGKATQSSTAHGGVASRAIDGNSSGQFGAGGQTHTPENQPNPWWELDLGAEMPIESITIFNRTDDRLGRRLRGYSLKLLDAGREEVAVFKDQPAPRGKAEIKIGDGDAHGSIRRAALASITFVRGKEIETAKTLARMVRQSIDRPAAIRALQRVPASYWPADEIRPLLESILAYVSGLPAEARTTPLAIDAFQLAETLASRLPPEEARRARLTLGELGVRVIRIGTVPHRMAFDQERFAVRAGKPVELILENHDIMPHNLVIAQPGSLEEVGLLAESTAHQPDSVDRHFVPPSGKVLHATRLLQPRESQKLNFVAPSESGVYPYVCTYPGHWRRMYGAMYVVDNLDAFQADPPAYLAAHSLPIHDELLTFNRPRTAWTYSELAELLVELEHGRSFRHGKQLFEIASCVACHRLNGTGNVFGPDLAQLDPKLGSADILRDIIEPSHKINEKFQSYSFELASGKIITGLILNETADVVEVIENPLLNSNPLRLRPSEIASRVQLSKSAMPEGLLDRLTRDEILDLVAYVFSRGNEGHELFSNPHQHRHQAGGSRPGFDE
jgi:putative heme-binding domain-containing protein